MTTNDDPTKASSVSASFLDKLQARIAVTNSFLCVGLDPSDAPSADAAFTVCRNLIDETYEYAVCYKPNAAFFERLGTDGHSCLQRVCDYIVALPNTTTPIPILLDVKRGDIGSTAAAYAKAAYDLNVDAVTLSPLMGWDSVEPFVSDPYQHKAAFLLCKTSNPGSQDLLNLPMQQGQSLYEAIAKLVGEKWSQQTTAALGLVVGATDPGAIAQIRKSAGPDVWILAPGVGAQGGNLEEALQAAQYQHILIPVSRGIARADSPKLAAQALSNQIKECVARYREQKKQQASESSSGDSSLRESIQPYQKEFIEFSLQLGVLKFGTFVLKSGRTSPYFFNAGMFCTGQALFRLAKAYAQTIMSSPLLSKDGQPLFDVLFGPAYKGISLGAVVGSALFSDFGVDVGFAYNRKEAKDHGEGGTLVGAPMKDKRVLIIDDVITAGTAIREAHGMLTSIGARPVGVVIALDRDEIRALDDKVSAVQAASRDLSIDAVSIVKLGELQTFLERSSEFDESTLLSVIEYRKQYGAS